MKPFEAMRHCLYAGDQQFFASMLTDADRVRFDGWRKEGNRNQTCQNSVRFAPGSRADGGAEPGFLAGAVRYTLSPVTRVMRC